MSTLAIAADEPTTTAPVVVTATRFAASIETAPVNITTITAKDIANSTATTLSEVLKFQAGVLVSDLFGIAGAKSTVDMGGFGQNGSHNTLIMLNGRRLNDVDLQGANLASIPLNAIAKIEIVHGSSTVLYGDNAVSGVINIVTKTGHEEEASHIRLTSGSFLTQQISTDFRKASGDTAFILNYDSIRTEGFRDNSAFDISRLSSEVSKDIGSTSFGLRINASREDLELPGPLNEPIYESTPSAASGTIEFAKDRRNAFDLFITAENFAGEFTHREKHQDAVVFGATQADMSTDGATPRFNIKTNKQNIVFGLDLYNSTLKADADFGFAHNKSEISRESIALYISDAISLDQRSTLTLGIRRQMVDVKLASQDVLAATSTQENRQDLLTAWDITFSDDHKDTGHNYFRLAKTFRFPVLDEMWSYFSGTIDLLDPQVGEHVELGTRQKISASSRFDFNLFRIMLEDEIAFDSGTFSNVNLDKTRHDGFNLNLRTTLTPYWNVNAGYAYRRATFRAGVNDGNEIPLIPRRRYTLSNQLKIAENKRVTLDTIYTGRRYFGDDNANVGKRMPSYMRLDLVYKQDFGHWKGSFVIKNLSNNSEADSGFYSPFGPNPYFYYPLPERAFYFTFEGEL